MSTNPSHPASNRRARQTEQTRSDVIDAARRCFAARGYARTSLKDVAAAAGVSVQTIYDSVGSKAELVVSLNDLIDEEAQIFELVVQVAGSTDAVKIASLPARITRRLLERSGDIVRVVVQGVSTDPGLAPVVEEGDRRHREGTAMVASRLSELGHLRPGLEAVDAASTLAVLADARVGIMLLDSHGLDLDQAEAWMSDVIVRSVLSNEHTARAHG